MSASGNIGTTEAVRGLARVAAPALGALALVVLLAACGDNKPAAGPGGPGGAPPPAEVGVVAVQPRSVGLQTELPGRLEALRIAQVRARAAGIVLQRLFQEGSDVKAGQRLFLIDPAPYQATLASAQAAVVKAQANVAQATALAERYKPLLEANAVSKQEYVNAVASQKQAEADVAAARAAVQTAQINLSYTTVTAPISGRIGRALVTEGALVGQGEATPLAQIQQINPMFADFTQSTTELLRLRRAFESGRFKRASGANAASVRIVLEDGSVYGENGRLLFADVSVDPTSGQITLRAEVPNPNGVLLPGMYVRVRLEQAETDKGILVPQQAVQRGSSGDAVMVVSSEGKVSPRPVRIGSEVEGQWVVLDGLKPGEMVMVDGFQKLRGNAPVKPVPWHAAGASAPGPDGTPTGPAGAAPRPASGVPAAGAPPSAAASR